MVTTGIVISGAGARGAYEAGMLSVLIPRLLADGRDQDVILVGTSSGAINVALLAAHEDPAEALKKMLHFWTSVEIANAIRSVWATGPLDAIKYLGHVAKLPLQLGSLLDSVPLRRTLNERVDWSLLDQNLQAQAWVRTAAVVATSWDTGLSVIFVDGNQEPLPDPDGIDGIDYTPAALRAPHIMASAAIPVVFPPAKIEEPVAYRGWYYDGGVRLNTPLKPAIQLGADRLVIIATTPDPDAAKLPRSRGREPDVFDAAGLLLQAALTDSLSEDVHNLRRINSFIAATGRSTSRATADIRAKYRHMPNLFLGPPRAGILSDAANRVYQRRYGRVSASLTELGLLGRLMGGSPDSHSELLSFFFFDSAFHVELIRLGRRDAQRALGAGGTVLPWR